MRRLARDQPWRPVRGPGADQLGVQNQYGSVAADVARAFSCGWDHGIRLQREGPALGRTEILYSLKKGRALLGRSSLQAFIIYFSGSRKYDQLGSLNIDR